VPFATRLQAHSAPRVTTDRPRYPDTAGPPRALVPALRLSDDDPSGIGTYSQAGSQLGFGVLWTAIFTFPMMLAVQEACARIALHTGVGLGTSLRRKFPIWLVGGCILALFVANTINVGADLGAVAAAGALLSGGHVSPVWLIPPIAVVILLLQYELPYQVIFRVFQFLTIALFAYVATVIVSHPPLLKTIESTFIPHIELTSSFIGILVAILGTTISPYLFFWQTSSEVDEMRRPADARLDRLARPGPHRHGAAQERGIEQRPGLGNHRGDERRSAGAAGHLRHPGIGQFRRLRETPRCRRPADQGGRTPVAA
jgi:Mn2+/Fe2+ NRAMP family transporter